MSDAIFKRTTPIVQRKYVITDRGVPTLKQADSIPGALRLVETLARDKGLHPDQGRFKYELNVRYNPKLVHHEDRF